MRRVDDLEGVRERQVRNRRLADRNWDPEPFSSYDADDVGVSDDEGLAIVVFDSEHL